MTTFTFVKDPQAVVDYTINWGYWLAGDTLATSTWSVDVGLTKDSESNTTELAVVWLSGGTASTTYTATNSITTTGGRSNERSVSIVVQNL